LSVVLPTFDDCFGLKICCPDPCSAGSQAEKEKTDAGKILVGLLAKVEYLSMATNFNSQRKLDVHLMIGIFFAASLALGDYGIRFYVSILQVTVPHRIIAGFSEPVTTKLVPAVAIVYVHQRYDVPLTYLQSRPYWFASLGGLSLGAFERVLYIVVKGASISPGFVMAPLVHVLNAVLIAGLIFASADRLHGYRFFATLLGVTVVAMLIHVFWNIWGVVLVHQAFS